ncbi:MAG: hypothetical protein ACREH3_08165, partial [Geminicoccales bacterium]
VPGLQRPDYRAESGFAAGVLAEGVVLSSNPLRRVFNGLSTTVIVVYVAWRIRDLLWRFPPVATAGWSVPGLESGL